MQYLEFMVGSQMYAIDILDVVSIEDNQKIQEVPMPAPYVKGMVMIRSDVMQVYDLASRLCVSDFEECTDKKYGNMLLVVEQNKKRIALEITQAKSIVNLDLDHLENAPETVLGEGTFIKGLLNRPEGLVIVLDVDKMLSRNTGVKELACA